MYSRYTSCKRVPKKRTKKRQTQVKRQGSVVTSRIKLESVVTSRIKLEIVETSQIKLESVVTSRIKLEIVETSRIKLESVVTSRIKLEIVETSRNKLEINKAFSISDRENTLKGTTTTTSGTDRRKVISPKVRKQVKDTKENSDTTSTTSRTNRAPSDRNCIEKHTKQAFQRVGFDQVWS